MRVTLLLFCVFFLTDLQAQSRISWRVVDQDAQPISAVSVSYKKIGAAALLGFARTDAKGGFTLDVKVEDVDSLQLEFNHLSYSKMSRKIPNKTAEYEFVLQSEVREIQEVKVGDMPVFQRKDTLNYSVGAFTGKEDRVIGDIIRKLPGIEMDGERILYRGKPIQKYMVNNLDLMEGRYGIINKNLSADAVKDVQIVENDQPIKILDSLVFSDRASLNLKLKKFTTSGTVKVGLGASPGLWDLNVTPMTFGKTFQMLNSLQSNNTGYDAVRELRPYYSGAGSFVSHNVSIHAGPSYISVQDVRSPGFEEKKWMNNKLFLFSTNVLQKLPSGLELKGNVSYYDDTRKRQGYTSTQYFTAEETIVNTEGVDNRFRINVLDAGVLLEKNEDKVYLRNNLKYHKRWNTDQGDLLFNGKESIHQRKSYNDEVLMNSFSMARFIGKQLVNIKSKIEWHQTPQRLSVVPGQMNDILYGGLSYDKMTQHVQYSGLRADNGVSFSRRLWRYWRASPYFDINYERNTLRTDILLMDGEEGIDPGADFQNDLHTSQLQLDMGGRLGFEKNKWRFEMRLPYRVFRYNAGRENEKVLSNEIKNTFSPSFWMSHSFNSNHELYLNGAAGKEYGGLDNFYNSYIMHTYRSMGRYEARLLGENKISLNTRYDYKNTLKANFVNLGYSYVKSSRDYIFRNRIDSLGRGTTDIEDRNSSYSNHRFSGGVSRFFASLKTVAKLRGHIAYGRSDYLLNDQLSLQQTREIGGGGDLINNLSDIFSLEYRVRWRYIRNKLAADKSQNLVYNDHFLDINLYSSEKSAWLLHNSYYGNNMPDQKNQYFLDASYRYTIAKWRTDVMVTAQNILNNDRFLQQISTNYELLQTHFELRPRQFLISTSFRF